MLNEMDGSVLDSFNIDEMGRVMPKSEGLENDFENIDDLDDDEADELGFGSDDDDEDQHSIEDLPESD